MIRNRNAPAGARPERGACSGDGRTEGSRWWLDVWDVTVTWRSTADSPSRTDNESTLTVRSIEELCDVVARCGYDPRVVSTRYQRRAELDMSRAPRECQWCGESFESGVPPRLFWYGCDCGGHRVYACAVCGYVELYPPRCEVPQ